MLHNLKNVFYFILLFSFANCSQDLYCRDENNQFVDWYVNYKLPKIEKGYSGTYLSEGKAYTYITSNIPEYWALSSNSINSNASMLGYTVQHLFNVQKKASYLLYNDEPPFDNGTAIGHLKGIVAFDGTSGFWIVHSIPKFTDIDKYEYPSNALENGQSILCMSFPASALNAICNQLLFSHPKIYKYGITDEVLGLLDDKARTIFSKNPNFVHKPPFESNVAMKSINQKSFVSFAKDNQLVEGHTLRMSPKDSTRAGLISASDEKRGWLKLTYTRMIIKEWDGLAGQVQGKWLLTDRVGTLNLQLHASPGINSIK